MRRDREITQDWKGLF
uniref:Uncharacterized protein n=1 Tax=Anguilla anguilla TaxID=7936 RepID=A0A0E9QAF4_ANGAN